MIGPGLTGGSIAADCAQRFVPDRCEALRELALADAQPMAEAASFIEHNGKIWGARREVVMRAGMAMGEALEAIDAGGLRAGPVRFILTFDEFNLACHLLYRGTAPLFTDQPVDAEALLDEDNAEALGAAETRLSALLIVRSPTGSTLPRATVPPSQCSTSTIN